MTAKCITLMYNIDIQNLRKYVKDLMLHACISGSRIRTKHNDNPFSLAFLRKKRLRIGMPDVLF